MDKILLLFLLLLIIINICIYLYDIYNDNYDNYDNVSDINNKTLVLYVFHQDNFNLKYFIKNGIFKDENTDFLLICNNKNIKIDIPDFVKIIFRENIGYDFGAWSDALLTNNLYTKYNNFIFINSSVLGPFVPIYYKNKWTNIFIDGLTDTIKLYGSTINTCSLNRCEITLDSHVQSYAFCMDKNTLEYLISKEIFSKTNLSLSHTDTVINKEIQMSREIINNNWNIGCILHIYNNIDFRTYTNNVLQLNDTTNLKYFNEYLHPYEVIFIKDKYYNNKSWLQSYYQDNVLENFDSPIINNIDHTQLIFVDENNKKINHLELEYAEQTLAMKYIKEDDVVLELGARYGTVSCIINKILNNKNNQVSVEPDQTVWNALETNLKNNNCNVNIVKGFISNKPLSLAYDGYSSMGKETTSSTIPNYTLQQIKDKYNIKNFNVLVVDCEGCMETFLNENLDILSSLRLIMFEEDQSHICNYKNIKQILSQNNFYEVEAPFDVVPRPVWIKK